MWHYTSGTDNTMMDAEWMDEAKDKWLDGGDVSVRFEICTAMCIWISVVWVVTVGMGLAVDSSTFGHIFVPVLQFSGQYHYTNTPHITLATDSVIK